MEVFLIGATGYIGSAVADALQAAGHTVIGLARSDDAAQRLEARGIRAFIGDLNDPARVAQGAYEANAVIYAASASGPDTPQTDLKAVEAILSALDGTGKPFIYTSGVWVMGNTGEQIADEETPLAPTPLVAWRPAVEQRVLAAAERSVRTVVIRPAIVYGRSGGLVAGLVQSARERGIVQFIGTGENRWSLVHIDDLCDLYVQTLEQAPAGTLLFAASGSTVRVREVAEAASRAGGAIGRTEAWQVEEARQTMGPYADALVLDQQISGTKAMRLFGWTPQAPSLFEELEKGSY